MAAMCQTQLPGTPGRSLGQGLALISISQEDLDCRGLPRLFTFYLHIMLTAVCAFRTALLSLTIRGPAWALQFSS